MSMPAGGSIRIPSLDVASEIARVNIECWRQTYSRLIPSTFFDERALQSRLLLWNKILSSDLPGRRVRVAEVNGQIVGFAVALPPERPPRTDLQLAMIYLLASMHGSGLGQQLLDAVLGDAPASLWMAEDNPRALAFYQRNRFESTGERRLDEGFDGLAEIRLIRGEASSGQPEQSGSGWC